MDESESKKELMKIIMFGINRTALLYNKERVTNPEKYNLRYQWDHLWFQRRRFSDPGFFRLIFLKTRKSPNFQSTRSFVMKAVLRDICIGKFNTEVLSGPPNLESVNTKNKSGNFDPRHTRRKLNSELKELVARKGRIDYDERKIMYSTAFTLDPYEGGKALEMARKIWEDEKNNIPLDGWSVTSRSRPIFLLEIFPEIWLDRIELQKKMLILMSSFGEEARTGKYFSILLDEIRYFSPYFIILCNHINSLCEISWFMKKGNNNRESILKQKSALDISISDAKETLSLIESTGVKSEEILNRMYPLPEALLFYGYGDIACELAKCLVALENAEKLKLQISLEYAAILRGLGKYKEMLEFMNSVQERVKTWEDPLTFALFKIRYAEANAFNGRKQEAINGLAEIFVRINQFSENYIPHQNKMKIITDMVINENEPSLDSGSVPVRVSVLENLIGSALRIKEYCLAKKYFEELFDTEKDYFRGIDNMDSFLNLQSEYNRVIFLCDSVEVLKSK